MAEHLDHIKRALAERYRIEREVGSGGMATVYLADDLKHHRKVAIKVLRPELAVALGSERFLREIDIAAGLTHPHILTLIDSGETDGILYYVMPYIEGESLRDKLVHHGELPVSDAVRILRDVVDALASAHKHGVVHRDIKPDNVLLAENHAVVTDFGIAKAVSEATGRQALTTAGVALGTPAYMAPEQAAADPHVDHRADIYAVGTLAYELLTGRPPFARDTPQAVLSAHVSEPPEPVTKHRAAVPPALAELVMKCLEKKAADRWQTAEELLQRLEVLNTPTGGITPTETQPVAAAPAPMRKNIIFAAAATAAVLTVGAVALSRSNRAPAVEAMPIDPNAVAVVPFRVSGDSSLAQLREGMLDLLHAKLTGDGGPRAIDPRTVMSAWNQEVTDDDTDLPLTQTLPLAARLGAGQILLGSIVGTAGRLTINASLSAVPSGRTLAEASVAGVYDSLPGLIDRFLAQLLSLRAGEGEQRLPSLTSTSLPALQAYLEGQRVFRSGRYLAAVGHFDRALELDSTFALAAYGLGYAGVLAGNTNTDAGGRGSRMAWELRDRLSERDRTILMAAVGRRYPGATHFTERLADWEAAVELAPDQAQVWAGLGNTLWGLGSYTGSADMQQRGVGALDRAIALDSSVAITIWDRFHVAVQLDDTAGVRRWGALHAKVDSVGERSNAVLWVSAIALGDSAMLAEARGRYGQHQIGVTYIGYVSVFRGLPLDDWERATESFAGRAVRQRERLQATEQRRKIALMQGRPSEAIARGDSLMRQGFFAPFLAATEIEQSLVGPGFDSAAAERVRQLERDGDGDVGTLICAAEMGRTSWGDTSRTRESLRRLRGIEQDRGGGFSFVCTLLIEAMKEGLAERSVSPALERLDSLMRLGPTDGQSPLANYVIARFREARGDLPAALAVLRRRTAIPVFASPGGANVNRQQLAPAMLREEGRIAALVGDTAGAIQAYQHYLTLRTRPGPELEEEVAGVRAALAELIGEGTSRN